MIRMRTLSLRLAIVATLLAWASTLLGAVWVAGENWADVQGRLARQETNRVDHEQRLRVIERQITQTARDVRWMRQHLEAGGGGRP